MKKLLLGLLFVFAISVVSIANQPAVSVLDNEISLAQEQDTPQKQKVEKKKYSKKCKEECCTKAVKADKKACCKKKTECKKSSCTKETKAKKECDVNRKKECCKKS